MKPAMRLADGLAFHLAFCVASCVTALVCSAAGAQPIRVLTLDGSRTSVCLSVDFNIASGNGFAEVRASILDDTNFGPAGIVPRDIELLPSVPAITPATLADADVVLIANAATGQQLDDCELRLLGDFVQAGGGVFMFTNEAAGLLGPEFGADGGDAAVGSATVIDVANPVASGPFGSASGTFPMGFHRGFDLIGPNGSAFLASSADIAASFEFGAGRAVLYCDEESFLGVEQSPCGADRIFPQTRTIFLNAVAYVTPAPGFSFEGGDSCCLADLSSAADPGVPDGQLTGADFFEFLNLFSAGDLAVDFSSPTMPGVPDGALTGADFFEFLSLFSAGC